MKLLTYRDNGYEMLGVASQDGKTVYSLSDIGLSFFNINDLIRRFSEEDRNTVEAFLRNPEEGVPYDTLDKCSPIPYPAQDVICLGENFMAHKKEAGGYSDEAFGTEKKVSIYFSKRVGEAVPDGGGGCGEAHRFRHGGENAPVLGSHAGQRVP